MIFSFRYVSWDSPAGHQGVRPFVALLQTCHPENLHQNVSGFYGLLGGLWAVHGPGKHLCLVSFFRVLSNALTVTNISNYLAGIRVFFILYTLPTDLFKDQRIQMFVKSLKINRPLHLKTTPVFSIEMLQVTVIQSQKFEFSLVFTALYLLAFYSFLRLSNIVPHAFNGFDMSRHLARGDVIFWDSSAVLILKWSKTNQLRDKVHYVTIPVIPQSLLCPVLALKNMLAAIPGSKNDPLFTISRRGCWLPLTDSIVRKHLHRVIKALGWDHHKYTFHTFRRSGASWAHTHNVPIQAIKDQGTPPFSVPSNSTYNLNGCLGEPFFYKMLKQLIFNHFLAI